MKRFVLDNLGKVPQQVVEVIEKTDLQNIVSSSLRLRWPWDVMWGENCKGNVSVAGDALHPMTPDLGQGGCAALEDSITLARCLAKALSIKGTQGTYYNTNGGEVVLEEEEYINKIRMGMEKYVKERKWRGSELVATAYVVGKMQQSNGVVMNFVRDKLLSAYLGGLRLKMADFDCEISHLHTPYLAREKSPIQKAFAHPIEIRPIMYGHVIINSIEIKEGMVMMNFSGTTSTHDGGMRDIDDIQREDAQNPADIGGHERDEYLLFSLWDLL
ncbi:hypothetical protein Scep_013455 [Stephania cephalantha]|uniref:FAD-binding domain-containing protein n=1 Tax=Stephania cephalantha TaxID=152367 RepID=A0AAP0P7F5_9MAGN